MAQTGQLRGRVSEEQLIDLLDQVGSDIFYALRFFLEVLIIIDGGCSREGRDKEINHCGTYSSTLVLFLVSNRLMF